MYSKAQSKFNMNSDDETSDTEVYTGADRTSSNVAGPSPPSASNRGELPHHAFTNQLRSSFGGDSIKHLQITTDASGTSRIYTETTKLTPNIRESNDTIMDATNQNDDDGATSHPHVAKHQFQPMQARGSGPEPADQQPIQSVLEPDSDSGANESCPYGGEYKPDVTNVIAPRKLYSIIHDHEKPVEYAFTKWFGTDGAALLNTNVSLRTLYSLTDQTLSYEEYIDTLLAANIRDLKFLKHDDRPNGQLANTFQLINIFIMYVSLIGTVDRLSILNYLCSGTAFTCSP